MAPYDKLQHLFMATRAMTLGCCDNGSPWTAPVYFVRHQKNFYFFSNETSRHIQWSTEKKAAASIFQDSAQMEDIFGLQMEGLIRQVKASVEWAQALSAYGDKFSFLKKQFGARLLMDPSFFKSQFNARLFCFSPQRIWLSDLGASGKGRREIFPKDLP